MAKATHGLPGVEARRVDLPLTPGDVRRLGRPIVVDEAHARSTSELRDLILSTMTSRPSAPTLNRGGWRSGDLLRWSDEAVRSVRDSILGCVRVDYPGRVSSWAMVNRDGDYHPRHVHQGAVASAVYYVDPGTGDTPTLFEVDGVEVPIYPVAGRLVLFSADMWHRVPPVVGGPRVTIAVDFTP